MRASALDNDGALPWSARESGRGSIPLTQSSPRGWHTKIFFVGLVSPVSVKLMFQHKRMKKDKTNGEISNGDSDRPKNDTFSNLPF